jgi:hypothetical protein
MKLQFFFLVKSLLPYVKRQDFFQFFFKLLFTVWIRIFVSFSVSMLFFYIINMRLNLWRILSHLEKQKLSTAVVDKTALSRAVEECTTQEAGEETKDILNLIRSDTRCIPIKF